MTIRSTFPALSQIYANTIVERKKDQEIVAKYDAKKIIEYVDMEGSRFAEIVLKYEGETATYNLDEFEIRTLMYCRIY